MNENGSQFRTAMFGGFCKQDVLEYITRTARDSQDRTAGMEKELEELRKEREVLTQRAASAEAGLEQRTAEGLRLSQELSKHTAELERTQRELEELKRDHAAAQARLEQLEKQVPALEAGAAAYDALKDRTATIELEAHRKAQETVSKAETQAFKTRSELEAWVRKVHSGYQLLRGDVSATVSHMASELERGRASLADSSAAFEQYDAALAALLEGNGLGLPKPPEPLPLDEPSGGPEGEEEASCTN